MNSVTPRIETILAEAVEIAEPGQRQAFVANVCNGDVELQRRVERLIANHFQAGSFLERPALALEAAETGGWQPSEAAYIPGTQIGPYKLLEQIGEGGMGLVYVAEQQQPLKRRVALKIIKPGMDSKQVIARFEAERQALALMDHPHIAKVHDAGTTIEGPPYFVMELVKGIPITDYCDQQRLGTRQRLELFQDVCQAVQHAHQKGIIHRDLKPSNVLVEVHDIRPVVKVIDFGVAKATGPQLTDKTLYTGLAQLVGTPLYMSPEQAGLSSLDVDTRSDVYSLGVLLYELLTGTTPFDSETLKKAGYDEMRRIIREDEPPRPSGRLSTLAQAHLSTIAERRGLEPRRLSQQLRGELDWIVMRALEKDRDRRYESASAFAADVQRYLNNEPVRACPPSPWYTARKFIRRHRTSALITACVLVAATVVGITVIRLGQRNAALQSQVEEKVKQALGESDVLQKQKKWDEARDAAQRAQGLLLRGAPNELLRRLVDARLVDLTLIAELEQLFTDRMTRLADSWWSTLSDPDIDRRYAAAFRKAGIDVEKLSIEDAVAMIGARGIGAELSPALDVWTAVRGYNETIHKTDTFGKKLQQLATALDPDPFRVKLRKVAAHFNDPDKMLASPELLKQPVKVIMSLAMPVLVAERRGGRWEQVLRALHARDPQDFWVNFELGSESRNPVDAVRYSMAAAVLRPGCASAYLNLGTALKKLGRLDDALAAFQEARRLRPDFFENHQAVGEVFRAKGRWDEAIECFKEAARVANPDVEGPGRVVDVYNNLGLALQKRGRVDEAIAIYGQAIQIAPDRAETHYYLGRALSLQGQPAAAHAAFKRLLKLAPNDPRAHNEVAWFWATCPTAGDRDPGGAVASAKRAVKLAASNGNYWNTLGLAHYRNGAPKSAIAALTRSIQLQKGGDSLDFFFLAMAHWQLDEKDQARAWYNRGVAWMDQHNPQDKELKRFRAEAAALLGVGSASKTPEPKR